MEEIFNKLPFNSYYDLFNSLKNGKANIKMLRSDCCQIASIRHPYFSILGMYIGFIITMFCLIYLSIKLQNYWLLSLIPINFILSSFIIYVPIIKTISWVMLFVDLFVLEFPIWVLITCLNIIFISFGYNIWWNIVYKQAIQVLQCNEEAFLWSWNKCGLTIEDCYSNYYNKLNISKNDNIQTNNNSDTVELLNIINNPIRLQNIIDGKEKINEKYLMNKQNPYTGETIKNYDDILKYLIMYQKDCEGLDINM